MAWNEPDERSRHSDMGTAGTMTLFLAGDGMTGRGIVCVDMTQ